MHRRYYAHSLPLKPPSEWQPLDRHLKNVAERAGTFAAAFESSDRAWKAGWLHDLGKCSKDFQDYLEQANDADAVVETARGRVDHSSAGARHAAGTYPVLGHLLSYEALM